MALSKSQLKKTGILGAIRTAGSYAINNSGKLVNAYKNIQAVRKNIRPDVKKKQQRKKIKTGLYNQVGRSPGASKVIGQTIVFGKKRKGAAKVKLTYEYIHNNNTIIDSAQGKQGVLSLQPIMTNLKNEIIAGNLSLRLGDQYASNLFEMIPGMISTSVLGPYNTDPYVFRKSFYLGYIMSEMTITNFSSASVVCTIYWCTPVKDNALTPQAAWADAIVSDRNSQSHVATFKTVPAASDTALAGTMTDPSQYGAKPTETKQFKSKWNIKKTNVIRFGPGEIVDLNTKIHYNKVIYEDHQSDTASEYLTGQTLVPMVVCQASPVVVVAGEVAAPGTFKECTYGAGRLGFIHTQTIKFGEQKVKQLKVTRVFNGIVAGTQVGYFVDEDGDQDVQQQAGNQADETGN